MKLEAKQLFFSYNKTEPVLQNINLDFVENSITVLAGVNGCGKSTLLKLLAGLLKPDSGEILLDGIPLKSIHRRDLARKLAYVPQMPELPPGFTVEESVLCGRYPHGTSKAHDRSMVAQLLDMFGIAHLSQRQLSTLSGGECQRCFLAMALAQEPSVLLLDEPFSALDPAAFRELFNLLIKAKQQYSFTVIIVLHDVNRALNYGDRMVGIKDGKINFHLPSLQAADKIQQLYDLSDDAIFYGNGKPFFF